MPDQTSCLVFQNRRVHSQPCERTNTEGKPVSNLILLSISDSDYGSLRPHLEYVSLPTHLVLHEAGGKLEFAFFPNRGLISLVVEMKDGRTAEAGIVGNEGFTGTLASVGLNRSPLQAVVQITGDGFRVEAGALQSTLESAPHLQLMLSRYAAIQDMQVAQTGHRVHPRCSEDREPQEARKLRLRVLRRYPTVRWRAWLEISPEVKTRPVLNCCFVSASPALLRPSALPVPLAGRKAGLSPRADAPTSSAQFQCPRPYPTDVWPSFSSSRVD